MATIILTGGGTAGHCTPHLAVLPYLKNDFNKIYYIGSKNGIEKQIITNASIPYYSVDCAKFKRKFCLENLKIPFKLLSGVKQAEKLLDMLKPDVIFSKGGYVSLPTVIAGHKRNIPIICHESDYTLGITNKITAKYCKKVLTSFPETAKLIKNGEHVGSPIRKNIATCNKESALKTFGFNGKKPILLVTGGSQGAKIINETLRKSLKTLLSKYDIIHICGKGNVDDKYKSKGYYQVEFMNKIENAFCVADVCISRAGSNTLFELMSLKIPCVLIPLPKGISRGDQVLNAKYFQRLGLATVLEQSSLTEQSLITAINSTLSSKSEFNKNFKKTPIIDASRKISRELIDCIKPQ